MERRCIYCLEEKADDAFNVEHVLPKAFGKFEHNVTLDCVCTNCNQKLGDTVDLKLARDTVEGLDRFLTGMKPAGEFKHYGSKGTTRFEVAQDGPMKGAWMKYTPSTAVLGDFDIEPLPQLGLSTEPDGDYLYLPLDRLLPEEELEAKGFKKGSEFFIRVWGATMGEAQRAMRERGYTWATLEELADSLPPQGRTRVESVFRISHPEFRAVAKIGFGYLASVCGGDAVRASAFHSVRRYVLADERPPARIVDIARASQTSANGHVLSIAQGADGSVIAYVTLFCRFLYVVRLADGGSGVVIPDATHFFDLETRRAHCIQ